MVAFKIALKINRIKKMLPQRLKKWLLFSVAGSGSETGGVLACSAASRWARISLLVVKSFYRVDCRFAKP